MLILFSLLEQNVDVCPTSLAKRGGPTRSVTARWWRVLAPYGAYNKIFYFFSNYSGSRSERIYAFFFYAQNSAVVFGDFDNYIFVQIMVT